MVKISTKKIFGIILVPLLFFLFIALFPYSAQAGAFCNGLGTDGIIPKQESLNISNSPILPDNGSRIYTINELFTPNASSFSVPYGHNKAHWLLTSGNESIKELIPDLTEEQNKKLFTHGDVGNCVSFGFSPSIQNFSKNISTSISNLIGKLTTTFFDVNFICDPKNPSSSCINLLGAISDEDGIINIFSKGIFLPFLILAFLFVGMYMMYHGMIKGEIRTALTGLLWSFFIMFIGLIVMLNPQQVARMPQAINTTIVGCMVQTLNGENCFESDSINSTNIDKKFASDVCLSQANVKHNNEKIQLTLNSLTCNITKAFTIDRWSNQQFGYDFDELYTIAPSTKTDSKKIEVYPSEKLQGSPEDYCVNMYSDLSPSEISKKREEIKFTNTHKVCNIALAYMANRTNGDFGTKAKMEHIIATATKDTKMWNAFTNHGRDMFGIFSFLGIIFVAISFIPVAIYGHVYSLVATILTAFAPIFCLFGIYPGRGRKIFLGWLETIVSSCLKFMASGLIMISMILIYSTVLKSLGGFMIFVVSFILCAVFINYRAEIVNLIGATNLGGVTVKNKASELIDKKSKSFKDKTKASVGVGLGQMVATDGNALEKVKGFGKGVTEGAALEMSKGNSLVSNAFKQGRRINKRNKVERKNALKEKENKERQEELNQSINQNIENFTNAQNENTKNNQIHHLNNQIENTKTPILQKELKNNLGKIENTKEFNDDSKKEIEKSNKIIEETKSFEKFLENNGGDVKKGKQDYLKEKYNVYNKDLSNKTKQMEKDNVPLEKIKDYKQKEKKRINHTIKEYSKNIEIENDSIKNFNLEKIIEIKDNFNINEIKPTRENKVELPPIDNIIDNKKLNSDDKKPLNMDS